MKAKFLSLVLVGSFLLGGASTSEAVVFNLEATIGGNSAAFPNSSYGFLVADTAGDGFQFLTDTSLLLGTRNAVENSVIGADDVMFAINLTLAPVEPGQNGFDLNQRQFNTTMVNPSWGAGDDFAIVWLKTGTSNVGDAFGFYRSDTVNTSIGSTVAFNTPGAGTFSLFDISTSAGGTTAPAAYSLNDGVITAVPEPKVIFLIAFAPILLKLLRVCRARTA
ncbi:MAG: hypothetical protein WA771_12540 [Chthoniobacterales bacterium]